MSNRTKLCRFMMVALSLVMGAPQAHAHNSLDPSEAVSNPNGMPPLPAQEALFPSIFGLGPNLRDSGVAVLLDKTNEFDGVVSGPRRGATNAGQYALETDIDWEALAGVPGFQPIRSLSAVTESRPAAFSVTT